ncbi:MAG: Bpu10I family restriction endonuclease [Gammaproteobacteria bacterium AqS3]|nr:Bpu10I family restriction endonuclease [Gammaproteobacteria bacterium AqS3]
MPAHGDVLTSKMNGSLKYEDEIARAYLGEIMREYQNWSEENASIKGPYSEKTNGDSELIHKRVSAFNRYKDFIDQKKYAEKFDSWSNLHSSALEEFLEHLFYDLVKELGSGSAISRSHVFFSTSSILAKPQTDRFDLPVVAIDCKNYLDTAMLESSSTAGTQIRICNSDAMYVICTEWVKLTDEVNLKKFDVDQIYVLRKQKGIDREFRFDESYKKNPIYADVVEKLFNDIRDHLTTDWEALVDERLSTGVLK